jgi:hypothetical protein
MSGRDETKRNETGGNQTGRDETAHHETAPNEGAREETVLMLVEGTDDQPPTAEQAADQLKVPRAAIDEQFGFVLTDPDQRLWTCQVRMKALPSDGETPSDRGPFANPRIEGFGPPKS